MKQTKIQYTVWPAEWSAPAKTAILSVLFFGAQPVQAADIILDNTGSAGIAITGTWTSSTAAPGYYGSNYIHDGDTGKGSKAVRFTPAIPSAGRYDVYVRWTSGPTRASNVPVDVVWAGGTEQFQVDQRSQGGTWVYLGRYTFNAGTDANTGSVRISNTGTVGYVIADAVRFVSSGEIILDNAATAGVSRTGTWTSSASAPVSSYYGSDYLHDGNSGKGSKSVTFTPDIPTTGSYSVQLKWNSSSNRATNVPVTVQHAGGAAQFTLNQRATGSGEWYYLGTYTFNAGTSGNIVVSNTGTDGYVVADAVRIAPLLNLLGYTLTFSEEFDGPLDVSSWGPGTKWIAHTPYNGDFGDAWFGYSATVNPYSVSNGILSIKAWQDPAAGNHWRSGLLASVDSQGNGFSQQYGYFEARMKLPGGTGTWPAFWLLSKGNLQTPKTKVGEIDAMEFYGNQTNKIYMNTHIWNTDGTEAPGGSFAVNFVNSGLTTGYHTYGVMVEPDVITWYVDGVQQRQVPTFPEAKNPLYILVDYALGGGWGTAGVGNPSYLYVDYIRAYSL